MKKAEYNNKDLIVDILTKSFEANQSVNYIVKQDEKRLKRIKALMDYSFEVCYLFGDVFLSDNNKACALVLYPDKKKTTQAKALKSVIKLDKNFHIYVHGKSDLIQKGFDEETGKHYCKVYFDNES